MIEPHGDASGRDPWVGLSRYTPARLALGRTGGSLRTAAQLDFRQDHARARDAVRALFDATALATDLKSAGLSSVELTAAAADRDAYLLRPDLGRRLAPESREILLQIAASSPPRDLVVIVSAGLAAQATMRHAVNVIAPLLTKLGAAGWTYFPPFIVPLARVKIQDEIGHLLGARHALMLLGERPGLAAPDSLGAYFTFQPNQSRTDADRNCVSNIRPAGLPPAVAAERLAALLAASARLRVSGTTLKDCGEISSLP